jgi:hypothetical protein
MRTRKAMNSSGKVLTIFLVIFVILSFTLAGLAMFFLHREIEKRKSVEITLEKIEASEAKLEAQLQDAIKQGFLLQEKNKEADEKINGLLDDLELEQGLREELKSENLTLKDRIDQEVKAKEELRKKLADSEEVKEKVAELEKQLRAEVDAKQELEENFKQTEQRRKELEEDLSRLKQAQAEAEAAATSSQAAAQVPPQQEEVELEKIVIAPSKSLDGRVLTVDTQTEFIIINLGTNHGISVDKILSVYRDQQYLGDVKITRVQPEMSAADFIPPLSSRQVRKNDQVLIKQ